MKADLGKLSADVQQRAAAVEDAARAQKQGLTERFLLLFVAKARSYHYRAFRSLVCFCFCFRFCFVFLFCFVLFCFCFVFV